MVVTASFARGAVRAAVEKHEDAFAAFLARTAKEPLDAPSTPRRFGEWIRRRTAIHQKDALLIIHGMVRRRSCGFAAFHPLFKRVDQGWNLEVHVIRLVVSPGRIDLIEQRNLPVRISGHALERMFQRTNAVEWRIIRGCLAGATEFLGALAGSYAASGAQQCAVPAERGLLVGQVSNGELTLRTFLPGENLNGRWRGLYDDLTAFVAANRQAIDAADLLPDEELSRQFQVFLDAPGRRWLRAAYVPGEDPMDEAWESRPSPSG